MFSLWNVSQLTFILIIYSEKNYNCNTDRCNPVNMIVANISKSPQALNRSDSAVSWSRSGLALAWAGFNLSQQWTDGQVTMVSLTWGELCECLLWSSVTNQGSRSTINHCSFCLLRLALEQPSNLSWEASEHGADSGEKAYRNNPTRGPTDSGGR